SRTTKTTKRTKKRRHTSLKDVAVTMRLPIKLVKRIDRFRDRLARDEDVMATTSRAFAIRELLVTGLQHAERFSIPRCVTAKLTKDIGTGPRRSTGKE